MGLNGKTTFLNAIMEVMGEYSLIGSHSLMLQSSNDAVCRNSDDVADLFGKRFVPVSETDMQHSFSEAKVKGLTHLIGELRGPVYAKAAEVKKKTELVSQLAKLFTDAAEGSLEDAKLAEKLNAWLPSNLRVVPKVEATEQASAA
jgi:hypothetical protein